MVPGGIRTAHVRSEQCVTVAGTAAERAMIHMKQVEHTVREYAAQEKVSEKTVRRWIDKGAVLVRHTPGGGVRIIERRDEPREPRTNTT